VCKFEIAAVIMEKACLARTYFNLHDHASSIANTSAPHTWRREVPASPSAVNLYRLTLPRLRPGQPLPEGQVWWAIESGKLVLCWFWCTPCHSYMCAFSRTVLVCIVRFPGTLV
jgi:hypothetical protein